MNYRVKHGREFAATVAGMAPAARTWLAALYGVLKVGPLPGESTLAVQPHAWLPNTYTVPFLDGHLVFGVPPSKGVIVVLAYVRE